MRSRIGCCHRCSSAVLALLLLFLGAEAFPLGDSSGEEEGGERGDPRASVPSPTARLRLSRCMDLAQWLHGNAANWDKELCQEQTACKGNMEMLIQNSLNLPKITRDDGCHYNGFQKEKCLAKISGGLYGFHTFLEYVQETYAVGTEQPMSILPSLQHLADTLNSMMNNPETVTLPDPVAQKALYVKLREHRSWDVTVIKHYVLQSFIAFMEKTTRTIRFLREAGNSN